MSIRVPLAYQLSNDQKEIYDDYAKQRSLSKEKAKRAPPGIEYGIFLGVFMTFMLFLFIVTGAFIVVH
jgi:hypothetical protein